MQAAGQGHAEAQNNLGALYASGDQGTPLSNSARYLSATAILASDAICGCLMVVTHLTRYLWTLCGFTLKSVRFPVCVSLTAVPSLSACPHRASAQAMFSIGMLHLDGRGVQLDRDEAGLWLEKAAQAIPSLVSAFF